jgi:hypothetical protein
MVQLKQLQIEKLFIKRFSSFPAGHMVQQSDREMGQDEWRSELK